MQDLPEYSYRKLGKGYMRLFVLFRGEDNDLLRGLICHMRFDNAGAFRALSYVWGPEQPRHKRRILVTPQGVLRIKSTLGAALQRLRRKTKELVLWIDAICINQEDEDEKVKQISLLPQIFQRAICTLAVVATDDKNEQTVRTLLQIAAVQAYGSDVSKWPKELGFSRTTETWMRTGLPEHNSAFWVDVEYLFQRPWFRRAWIVQEAIAARTVTIICGKWTFDWNVLHSTMEVVDRKLGTTSLANAWRPFMVLTEHREWEARSHRWPLLDLLETFRYAEAGMQRDRVFSLLGLAIDADHPLFEPDYKSPLYRIVRRFAQAFIERDGGMRLLCLAGLGHAGGDEAQLRASDFPSRVPDWTRETVNPWPLSSATGRGVTFSASGKLKVGMRYEPDNDVLHVASIVCERIASVSRFCNEPSQRSRYFQELDAMIEACELIDSDRRQELKETVPVAGAIYPDTGVSSLISVSESYMAYRKVLRKDDLRTKSMRGSGRRGKKETTPGLNSLRLEEEHVTSGFREKSKTYAALLDAYIIGWKFVMTASGRCGIAPNGVLPGDIVAIVSGGNVPFILREGLAPARGTLFLVSECYIDGLMFGEAVEVFKTKTWIPNHLYLD